MTRAPLAVLDLVPISSGSTAAQALRNSIDLAQAAERFGYARYWFAEHHLNPGVAGTSPAVVLALTAAATSTIRIGSGAVQLGHRTALVGGRGVRPDRRPAPGPARPGPGPVGRAARSRARARGRPAPAGRRTPQAGRHRSANGLLIPERFAVGQLLGSPRFALQKTLLQLPGAAVAGLHRAGRRHPRPAPGQLPLGRRGRGARHPRRRRRPPGLDPGQQRRGERPGGRGERAALRGQLPRQPGHRAGGGRGIPGRVPALRRAGPALRERLRRRRGGQRRGRGPGAGRRLRPVGAQHPHRRGRDPVPDPGAGPGPPLDRRGPGPGRRPGGHPVHRLRRSRSPTSSSSSRRRPAPTS